MLEENDLNRIPPDFEKAKKHKRASKVFDIEKARIKLGDSSENFCECCGEPLYVAGTDYSLCIDTD